MPQRGKKNKSEEENRKNLKRGMETGRRLDEAEKEEGNAPDFVFCSLDIFFDFVFFRRQRETKVREVVLAKGTEQNDGNVSYVRGG